MKKLLFVLFVLLQSGYLVNAQNDRTFYKICETENQPFGDFHKDFVNVKTLTNDSIIFESNGSVYSAKKVPDFNFLSGKIYVNNFYLYKVDDNSFLILGTYLDSIGYIQEGSAYYHADKNKKNEADEDKRCEIAAGAQFSTLLKAYNIKEKEKDDQNKKVKQAEFDSQTKGVITDFMKNYKSKKVDPALDKAIRQRWDAENDGVANPLLRIYFMDPTYSFFRNEFGIVIRKTVTTSIVYKWKKNGLCFMQWRWYGYESLGGGAFSDEIKYWTGDSKLSNIPGNREILSGKDYEVDCAAFQ